MRIVPIYFWSALFVGMLLTYVTAPKPHVIIKTPTPDNAGQITYIDDNDVCYKYEKKEVICPMDSTIKTVKIE